MWGYKLVTENGECFYYDNDELELALEDRKLYGGTIYDRNGKCFT